MLSIIHHDGFEPAPAAFSMAAHVLAHAAAQPEKIALLVVRPTGAERWSYGRLEAAVRGAATGFARMGLVPGDRVLLRVGNSVGFPVAFLGAIAAGMIPVPTSSQLTGPEVERIVRDISPALIVAGAGVALPATSACPVVSEDALHHFADLPPAAYDMGDPGRLAYIIYTSGTSGQPRAVMHAHRAVWARRMMWRDWYDLHPDDRLLHAGAFNWTYTLGTGLMDPWAIGATALVPGAGVEAGQLPLLLKRFDATIFAAAPGVYRQMLRAGLPTLPRLRHGLSAGEALADTVRRAWAEATGTRIYEALGMSECSTFVSAAPGRAADGDATAHIPAYPQRGRHVAVLDASGEPVPRGVPGTLAVHRDDPGLFLGYLDQPDETAARFAGPWFLTGDTVSMEADGEIRYLGRDDDMMNAGGYRVSPIEVETAMNGHPAITEAAAVELRVRADASVIALFYTAPDPVAEEVLADHAAGCLARYKQPRMFLRAESLPRNANGKINRRALRDGWEEQNR